MLSSSPPINMDQLPKELQMMILRKLDIDARRAIGLYTKLKIPSFITNKLLDMPKIHDDRSSCIVSPPINNDNKYELGIYINDLRELIDFRVCHKKGNLLDYFMIWTIMDGE